MMKKTKYLVVGLGPTGLSCVKYLRKLGHVVTVTDSRDNPPGLDELAKIAPDIQVECGALSREFIQAADCLVMSPGVSLDEPVIHEAIQNGKAFLGDIELFAQAVQVPVVGITGSNGKSTVTTLVGEMAKNAGRKVVVAGNIGTPILEVWIDHPDADLYVLELSSFQLETTHSLHLLAAAILNMSENHLDRHKTMQAYIHAKQRIYQHAENAIINREDFNTFPTIGSPTLYTFGLSQAQGAHDFGVAEENGVRYLTQGTEKLIPENELSLRGGHNVLNALAALALGTCVGLPLEAMLKTLKSFQGLPHRCELITEKKGVRWYNDSKATTIAATSAALKTLGDTTKRNVILIAGGVGKGVDFTPLHAIVEKYVKQLVLIGVDGKNIQAACEGAAPSVLAKTLKEAIDVAKGQASHGDVVLLAPACASFDMFKNFEHRGDVFRQMVREQIG